VALSDDLERIAAVAAAFATPDEHVSGIVAAEPLDTGRTYLCAYEAPGGHAWLALDADGEPVASRHAVRAAASLSGLCEIAEESAGGADVQELLARLAELQATEAPEGIEEAVEAAKALAATLEPEPRLATTGYLDRLGAASRRLEQALGEDGPSPFGAAMQQAVPVVEELTAEIERTYKGPLA
jgi:hypothetical protein